MCEYCDIADGARQAFKVYEDDKVMAFLSEHPAAFGHVIVMPRHHHQIIEQVPDYIVQHLSAVVNKLTVAMFESLGAQGTNLLICNGVPAGQKQPHFAVSLIPRREKDGLQLQWQPKQISQDDLSTVELELNEYTRNVGEFEKEKPKPIELDEDDKDDSLENEDNSYRVKHLTRIP